MNEEIKVESNLYDEVEYVFGVDLQILTNSVTEEQSIGWTHIGTELSKKWRENNGEASN